MALAIQRSRVVSDKRGAIMVLGIFMACVMIGWMWMMIGLGDAMIWRDRTQEAADAMAYTSAAVQARGMNFIAFLNMIMLVITAIYLGMAFIYNITDFLLVLVGLQDDGGPCIAGQCLPPSSCSFRDDAKYVVEALLSESGIGEILAMLPGFCEVSNIVRPIHDTVGPALKNYDVFMGRVLPPIASAQKLVARVAPWVGSGVATLTGMNYTDWGKQRYGTAISSTLVPASGIPAPIINWDKVQKWKADTTTPYTQKDGRLGLPVEDNDMSLICKLDGKIIINGIMSLANSMTGGLVNTIKNLPIIGTIINGIIDMVSDTMAEAYCSADAEGLFGGSVMWGLDNLLADAWKTACAFGTICGIKDGGGPTPDHSLYHVRTGGNQPDSSGGNDLWNNKDKVGGPKTVVGYAGNGNDWFQVYGFAFGGNRPEQSEKKVAVAGFNFNAPADSSGFSLSLQSLLNGFPIYMAQAEFYLECPDVWSGEECNGGTGDNFASFKMDWRTRLRRVHGISWGQDILGWFWNENFGSQFDETALSWIKNSSALSGVYNTFGAFKTDAAVDGVYKTTKDWVNDKVGGMIDPATALPETIH